MNMERRGFLRAVACAGVAALAPGAAWAVSGTAPAGLAAGRIAHLDPAEGERAIRAFADAGERLFVTATAYGNGEVDRWFGRALRDRRDDVVIIHQTMYRRQNTAYIDLLHASVRLKTMVLDGWMVHDLRNRHEWDLLRGPDGALPYMFDARQRGWVRSVGVSGHRDASLMARAIREVPFDRVMVPEAWLADPHNPFVRAWRELPGGGRPGVLAEASRGASMNDKPPRPRLPVMARVYG